MYAMLILVAFPLGDVVIGIVGVAVGPVEEKQMGSGLKADLRQGRERQLGLQPCARQGVTFHDLAAELVVLKESQCVHPRP